MWFIVIALIISWILGMLLTIKMDRIFTKEPMRNEGLGLDLIFAFFLWWHIALLLLTTEHETGRNRR
jgi:hypothetical protein